MKNSKTRGLVLDPGIGFLSYKPDWNWVRAKVKKAISETAANATPSPSESASPNSSPSTTTPPPKPTTRNDDLAAVCSYHPRDYKPTKR